MIRAVFFDFYGTLVHWSPSAERIQRLAAAAEGVHIDEARIARAYSVANAYMDAENASSPIRERNLANRETFFAEYEHRLLLSAGADVTMEKAALIWARVKDSPKELALFSDARDTLAALSDWGLKLGIISNIGPELDYWLDHLSIADWFLVRVTSANTGVNKPHRVIFEKALEWIGASAKEAVHVGDSFESDVLGARAAGIEPIFLRRNDDHAEVDSICVVEALSEVVEAVGGRLSP